MINRLVGVLFAFSVATEIVHNIPDIMNITMGIAQGYGSDYRHYKNAKLSDKDDDDIKLPKLEGHKNWIAFRDHFETSSVVQMEVNIQYYHM